MNVSSIERLMFRAIPLWFVFLMAVIGIVLMIAFGNVAVHAYKGGTKAGAVGDVVLTVSTLPELVHRIQNKDAYLRISGGFHEGKAGFAFRDAPGTRPDAGFLLLSRFDGDRQRSVIEFWDLDAQALVHKWLPPIDEINDASTDFHSNEIDLQRDRNQSRMLVRHPVVTPNGDLLIKSRTPLTRLDACNRIVWINDDSLFHHAVEQDDAGTAWMATKLEPPSIRNVDRRNFIDDAITNVSPDGEILLQRSVSALFLENGLPRFVYPGGEYSNNPIHLNDVQPVLEDGPHWKRGDLFLSLRNNSMIVLYRPSTDEIIWWKQGPWSHQHDVDVLDDHRISVFDNHSFPTYPIEKVDPIDTIGGHSDIAVYDFDADTVSYPWSNAMEMLDMTSQTEGLHKVRPNGALFVEEQNRGRLFEIDTSGAVIWEYVNRSEDGFLYRTGWSRLLEPEDGKEIAEALSATDCNG